MNNIPGYLEPHVHLKYIAANMKSHVYVAFTEIADVRKIHEVNHIFHFPNMVQQKFKQLNVQL